MGKKNVAELAEQIYDQYLDNSEPNMIYPLLDNIDKIIDNNNGCHLVYREFCGYGGNVMYKVIPKFMQKYNKKLKKNRRSLMKYEFGRTDQTWNTFDPEIYKLSKYALDAGKYIAQFDDSNYCIYVNKFGEEDMISSDLYFIGDNWRRYRKKFQTMVDHYNKICEYKVPEVVQGPRGRSEVLFKGFDKFIMSDKDKVLKYIDNWLENIPTYHEKYEMIPKLSILLYGDPGTGKSTFYKALAKYLNIKNVQLVDSQYLTSSRSNSTYGFPTVFAIDDIDCIVKSRKDNKGNDNQLLQALLEFLDNPPSFQYKAKNGKSYPVQIVVATTNFYDKLDPAVRRYGRFDLQIEMCEFDKKTAQEMCSLYDLNLGDVISNSNKKNFRISPAKLQAICINSVDNKLKSNIKISDGLIKLHRIK